MNDEEVHRSILINSLQIVDHNSQHRRQKDGKVIVFTLNLQGHKEISKDILKIGKPFSNEDFFSLSRLDLV